MGLGGGWVGLDGGVNDGGPGICWFFSLYSRLLGGSATLSSGNVKGVVWQRIFDVVKFFCGI